MTRRPYTPRAFAPMATDHVLSNKRSALWAGMGLGKTPIMLTALDGLFLSGMESQPAIVLAPLRVARSTWSNEAAKWAHLRDIIVSPIVGDAKQRAAAIQRDASVYTCNYENLPWLVDHLGERWPFGTVIADESTKLKGFRLRQGGQRARAIGRIAHKKVHRWVNLTGTPSPNGLIDLWGQTWFLDAGQRLGRTFDSFKQRWFRSSFDGFGVHPLPHAQAQIEAALADICLTIDPRDHFDLREPIVNNICVDLPTRARALYQDMEKRMFMEIEGEGVEAFNAAARTMKCLQIANGAAYTDDAGTWADLHDAKLQALEDVIEEAAGMPVLVAYHFKSDLARMQKAFPKGRHFDANPQTLQDFAAGKIPILFIHPASGGHGVDGLQDGTNIIVFFGHWWDLEQYQQVIERVGPVRQYQSGHDRPVFIHHIIARDTIDETVMERRETKREVQDLLLEAMKRRK